MFPNFFMQNCNIGNWYPSAMNYDICTANPFNTMNLHMNQAWDDMIARQSFHMVPQYDFGNMFSYGSFTNNSFLLDPRYTIAQTEWAKNNSAWQSGFGGFGGFGSLGGVGGGFNMSNPWGNMGLNLGNSEGSSSKKVETEEDKEYNRKYTQLLGLCKQLKEYDGIAFSKKEALKDAIKDTKGTPQEKYERLKKAYDAISDNTVKKFLKNNSDYQLNGKEADKNKGNSLKDDLIRAGHEYTGTAVDNTLDGFENAIKELKNNANQTTNDIVGKLDFNSDKYSILDILSSWNTRSAGTNNRNIITFISANINLIKNKTEKQTAISTIVKPIANNLADKAEIYLEQLDDASKTKLQEAIKEVRKETEKYCDTGKINNLATNFDKLYVLTRLAAIKVLQNEVNRKYGAIDSGVFNDKLFIDDTKADLDAEGFKDKYTMDDIKVSEEIAALVETEEESAVKTESENAEEKPADGTKVDDNGTKVDGNGNKGNVSGAASDENENKDGTPETKAVAEAEEAAQIAKQAEENGKKVMELLGGWTSKNDDIEIADILTDIDSDNIYPFLKGVYTNGKTCNCEGLIEKLDDDTYVRNGVTMEKKLNIIKSVLDKARELGLENKTTYTELEKLYDEYATGDKSGRNNFNKPNDFWSSTWLVGAIVGSWTNDNEQIDMWIGKLYDQIDKIEKEKK